MLERLGATDTLNGLPSGGASRTVFFVVNYEDNKGLSGLVYGDSESRQAFGLTADGADETLVLHGWGRKHDFDSDVAAGGWIVQSAVLDGRDWEHFRDGDLIASGSHRFDTDLQRLVIGERIAGGGFGEMEVAAALIYDRALSDAERGDVEIYLQQKYIDDAFLL